MKAESGNHRGIATSRTQPSLAAGRECRDRRLSRVRGISVSSECPDAGGIGIRSLRGSRLQGAQPCNLLTSTQGWQWATSLIGPFRGMFTISESHLDRSLAAISKHGYGSFFPEPPEFRVVRKHWKNIRPLLASFDLDFYEGYTPIRSFAPKSSSI